MTDNNIKTSLTRHIPKYICLDAGQCNILAVGSFPVLTNVFYVRTDLVKK